MKNSHPIPRREFLQRTAAGIAGATLGSALVRPVFGAEEEPMKKIPIGVQLYSVREECKADFPGTLEKVSKIGFRRVEFAGYWGRNAKEVRKMLDDNGLVTCGTHTQYADIQPDKLEATIEFNQVIGNKFMIVPWMEGKSKQDWLDRAKEINALSDKLRPLGMWTGYHAHQHDFQLFDGEAAWDIFFGNTKPEVIMQLDTSNCMSGGKNPVEVLNRYPGRVRTIHIKPFGGGPEAVLGQDQINWPAVFEFCENRGGTQVYVVEHETSKHPLDTLQRTYEVLQGWGKV